MSARPSPNDPSRPDALPEPPAAVRYAGIYGMIQGLAGVAFGILLLVRDLEGFRDSGAKISGWGTSLWFFCVFGAVAISGWFLMKGKAWGRGPIVMLQLCLIPVAYYMFTSGRPEWGIPTVLVLLVGLGLVFNPAAVAWWSVEHYGPRGRG